MVLGLSSSPISSMSSSLFPSSTSHRRLGECVKSDEVCTKGRVLSLDGKRPITRGIPRDHNLSHVGLYVSLHTTSLCSEMEVEETDIKSREN